MGERGAPALGDGISNALRGKETPEIPGGKPFDIFYEWFTVVCHYTYMLMEYCKKLEKSASAFRLAIYNADRTCYN